MNVNFGRSASQAKFASTASSREFLTELVTFHERRRTAFGSIPMINGRPLNLHKLYLTVCALGGCRKVTEKNRWQKVCAESGFLSAAGSAIDDELTPSACTNSAYACKLIYTRWLEPFERVHLFGQPDDPLGTGTTGSFYFDDAFEPTRTRRCAAVNASATLNASGFNDTSIGGANGSSAIGGFQRVAEAKSRVEGGLSSETRTANEYDRLVLALLSGLPNEVDLAFNALVLLASSPPSPEDATESSTSRHGHVHVHHSHCELDLRKAPGLVDLMLAHIGFYSPDADSLFPLDAAWRHAARRNYFRFWWNATKSSTSRPARRFLFPRCFAHDAEGARESGNAPSDGDEAEDDCGVLCEAEQTVLESAEATRVYQTAFVLHAVSFDTQRGDLLLSRDTFVRFLLVSISCSHLLPLRRQALDTLINLIANPRGMHAFLRETSRSASAPDSKRRALLSLARSLLESADRHDVLAGLELVTAIAHGLKHHVAPPTDAPIQKHDSHGERAACFMRLAVSHVDLLAPCHRLLLVADAALVVGSLEALLALASTKQRSFADNVATNRPQLLTLLVAFLSLDARALGKPAMSGCRVLHESVAVSGRHNKRERERERDRVRPITQLMPQQQESHVPVVPATAVTSSRPVVQRQVQSQPQPQSQAPATIARTVSNQGQSQAEPAASQQTVPMHHGRAAALQWLFLRCEMNDSVAASSKSSRSSAAYADVTSDADLYADYLRYVNTAPVRPAPCSTCGAPSSSCTCNPNAPPSTASVPQALTASELKLVIRQVYPQIREAPTGGFIGLKLKSYLHSAVKSRPVPPVATPVTSTVSAITPTTPVNCTNVNAKVMLNGQADKPIANGIDLYGSKRPLSPLPNAVEQPQAKVLKTSEPMGNGVREDDDEDEDYDSESSDDDGNRRNANETPQKRKRGRPRKNLSGVRRPFQRNPKKPDCNESTAWTTNGVVQPQAVVGFASAATSATVAINGDDETVRKNGVLRAEPPSVFAATAVRRDDGSVSPAVQAEANADSSVSNGAATVCSVTREVIIERMKSKLERQRNERECAAAISSDTLSTLGTNGIAENGLVMPSLSTMPEYEIDDTNSAIKVDVTPATLTLNGFRTSHKSPLAPAEAQNHVDVVMNGEQEAAKPPSPPIELSCSLATPLHPQPQQQLSLRYTCKWQAAERCVQAFGTLRELLSHVYASHCDARAVSCCWPDCPDASLQRSGYSLYMHLEERHCRDAEFVAPAAGVGMPARASVAYPANAALQAVRKLAPRPPFRELIDASEGVLTKHIRLTAALVLGALSDASPLARDALRRHVPTLAQVAFADRDASSTVARILQRIVKHEFAFPIAQSTSSGFASS